MKKLLCCARSQEEENQKERKKEGKRRMIPSQADMDRFTIISVRFKIHCHLLGFRFKLTEKTKTYDSNSNSNSLDPETENSIQIHFHDSFFLRDSKLHENYCLLLSTYRAKVFANIFSANNDSVSSSPKK